MVETGHGTADNFKGQAMKIKILQQNLYAFCSVAARFRLLIIHLFVYLFIYSVITLSLSRVISLNYGIISEEQIGN